MNYEELIKALRSCAENFGCPIECPRYSPADEGVRACVSRLEKDAAAAIEDLQAEVRFWEAAVKGQEDGIKVLQTEVKRLKECNDELREAQTYIDHYGDKWMTSAKDIPTSAYNHGYMDGKNEAQPHWVSVAQPPKDKQECFVAYKGPLGFVYDTGRFYDDLNSGLDEDIFVEGTSGFVFGGEVGYALESMDYWMPIEPPQEVQE